MAQNYAHGPSKFDHLVLPTTSSWKVAPLAHMGNTLFVT